MDAPVARVPPKIGARTAAERIVRRIPTWLPALLFVVAIADAQAGVLREARDATLWLRDFALHRNLHAVVPGELYRAAEMSHERLERTIHDKRIATVIDLRNGPPDADVHGLTEADVVVAAGATYVHVPLLTSHLPSKSRLLQLVDVIENARRPVLVHCSSGALRTGVVATIWLISQDGMQPDEARQQLDIRYGYSELETNLSRWNHGFDPLVTLLDEYAAAYRASAIPFREWVEAGADRVGLRGLRRFYPPGKMPDHS